MRRWAVIACDQFTSEPAYWEEADRIAGDAPSALRLILPEAELGSENVGEKIAAIQESMRSYLASGLFRVLPDSFLYTERLQSDGRTRKGLVGKIDLEAYDYNAGSTSPVRATSITDGQSSDATTSSTCTTCAEQPHHPPKAYRR